MGAVDSDGFFRASLCADLHDFLPFGQYREGPAYGAGADGDAFAFCHRGRRRQRLERGNSRRARSGRRRDRDLVQFGSRIGSVPASVVVPAGATFANFSVSVSPVSSPIQVTISAAYSSATANATLTLNPVDLSWLTVQSSAIGGSTAQNNAISLNAIAPSAFNVSLSSSVPGAATAPQTVTVPSGAASASFSIATTPVATSTMSNISASGSIVTLNQPITVLPPSLAGISVPGYIQGGANVSGNVFLTGPSPQGGVTVSLLSSNSAPRRFPRRLRYRPAHRARHS